ELRDDAAILNVGQRPLTALEEAKEISRRRNKKETWVHIAASMQMSVAQAMNRVWLLRLAPDLQRLIDPRSSGGKRLDFPVSVLQQMGRYADLDMKTFRENALMLGIDPDEIAQQETDGERVLDFALQRAAKARIEALHLRAVPAIKFLKDGTLPGKSGKRYKLRESGSKTDPADLKLANMTPREALRLICRVAQQSGLCERSAAEIRNAMNGVTKEDLLRIAQILDMLGDVAGGEVRNLAESKPASHPEVLKTSTPERVIWEEPTVAA
ncbi:MAG: hypothetical protein AAFO91_14610, partial [Bacteroidota bacterium]